jgi:hypothetical protein
MYVSHVYTHSSLVQKGSSFKENKRVFIKDTSVFSAWKEDNKLILDKACEHDFENWKLQKVVKDSRDVSDVKQLNLVSMFNYARASERLYHC